MTIGVRAHRRRVLHQPVDRAAPRLFEELGIFVDLPADDRAQPGHNVAAETAAAHDDAKALAYVWTTRWPGSSMVMTIMVANSTALSRGTCSVSTRFARQA